MGVIELYFCSKTTPSSKCLSIWLSICLFIPFFITITSSSFLWSLRDVQIGILYKYLSTYMIWLSILYLFISLCISVSVFPFIHLLNNNQHLSSDHFKMHSNCEEKFVYISNNSSIFQSLQTNPFTYMAINLYIFQKSVFWDTLYYYLFPCMLFVCPLSQLACWG